jgi:FtsP/CotA-like multicopper oxidase with cupredoxin domain
MPDDAAGQACRRTASLTENVTTRFTRRRFLSQSFSALVAAGGGALFFPMACGRDRASASVPARRRSVQPRQTGQLVEIQRTAQVSDVDVGSGRSWRTWTYDGAFPAKEIRVQEGDRLRVVVANQLPEETTIHWHGVPLPNPMDGVPGVTQAPITPGGEFVYDFVAAPSGTYLYHTHVGLQLDRGLLGALIIEERQPRYAYDRDYTLVLDDFLSVDPRPLPAGGGMMGGMMSAVTPPYEGLLINGRLPSWPAVFEMRRAEKVRLRLVNLSGATTFRVAIAGHRMTVVYADGRAVEPRVVDSLVISMGERYDVLVDATNPGAWNLMAAPIEVQAPAARAVLRYIDSAASAPPSGQIPEGLSGGASLSLGDLVSIEDNEIAPRIDRRFDLVLSGGMMGGGWTINGQAYPNADPFEIHEGEMVGVRMRNQSTMIHPMHLHGHFFRTGRALKDTVMVPPMGAIDFTFAADNPGQWFFHCHNLYHMEAGMARVFRYA